MADQIDSVGGDESPEAEGSESSPKTKGTPEQDPIALMRKRQAGAEAARQEAARQLVEVQAKLEKYESADRTADQNKAADIATLQAKLEFAEKRAAEADVRAEARVLDVKYPNARKQLPEITDEVRLAYFEQVLGGDDEIVPPPQNPNESNRVASGDPGSKPKAESSEDILARLKGMGKPDWL